MEKIILGSMSILIFLTINHFYYNGYVTRLISEKDIYNDIYKNTIAIGIGAEYLPVEFRDASLIYQMNSNSAYSNSNISEENEIEGIKYPNLSYVFNNQEIEGTEFTIPFIYYYGYVANITTPDGEVHSLEVTKDKKGFVKVKVEEGLKGEIRVWYHGTRIQKISLLISATTILLTLGFLIINKLRKRK